jgi:hypothetical protein
MRYAIKSCYLTKKLETTGGEDYGHEDFDSALW